MSWLTPAERRGASVLVALLLLGAGWDWWRAGRPVPGRPAASASANRGTVPTVGPDREETDSSRGVLSGTTPLDLNRATAGDLDALPGIGPVLAGRIVAHRERLGRFRRVEDLLGVRGVGPRLLERLRLRVSIGTAADTTAGRPGAGRNRRGGHRPVVHSAKRPRPGRADSPSVLYPASR